MSSVFIRHRRRTRKELPSWRRIAEVRCERALRVSGPALIQQLAVEAVQDWLQTVRDAEVVVNLAQVVNDDLLGGANLVSD
jgi:hypothetical protein